MSVENGAHGRVIVAWDGSRTSAATFPLAAIVANQLGDDVEILHVLGVGDNEQVVERIVKEVGFDGLDRSSFRIVHGEVVESLIAAAAEAGVSLLVLTTHVGSIAEGRHLGHIAEAVVSGAERPVLLVRPEAPAKGRDMKKLLLPVDGTPKTAQALKPAMALAKRFGASLELLYVAGPQTEQPEERGSIGAPRYVDQKHHEWPAWSSEVADRFARYYAEMSPEVPVRIFLAHGDIDSEIVHFASEHGSDAVVLVRRSHLESGRAQTLRSVLARSPCPVFVLGGPVT